MGKPWEISLNDVFSKGKPWKSLYFHGYVWFLAGSEDDVPVLHHVAMLEHRGKKQETQIATIPTTFPPVSLANDGL